MPQGVGGLSYLSDEDENVTKVSRAGRVFSSDSYQRIKRHSPLNVSSASGGSRLESVDVGLVYLRSESGNSPMWWGGVGDDSPYSGNGYPLWGGEESPPIRVTNMNAISVVSSVSGQIVYPIGFLNGIDVVLSNEPALQPVIPPDSVAPLVTSHSPVSGFSGVALNSEVSATFDEEIASGSVISGSFRLSPAHNVTLFRAEANVNQIVMTPNTNLSGSTVYFVGINSDITDLAGNPVSGTTTAPFTWKFTTDAAPPPPDTTPPWVSGTTPVSGATNVSAGTNVVITFSEAMLSGTITAQNIYLSYLSGQVVTSGISGSVSLAADQKTATIDPTPTFLSGSTVIHVNILSGCQDLAGNGLSGGHDRRRVFTTGTVDTTAPVVSGTSPANGVSNVSVDANIVINFSENMLSGTLRTSGIFLSTTSGGNPNPSSYSITVSGNQKSCHIDPTTSLQGGQQYYINVLDTVTDLAGNTLSGTAGDRGRNFTTTYNFTLVYSVTGGGTGDMNGGGTNDTRIGAEVDSTSNDLTTDPIKKITFRLRKNGSPTGTINIRIRRGSNDSIAAEMGSMSASSLTTSYLDYTFTNLTNTYTCVDGDHILAEFSGGDLSNMVEINRNTTGDVGAGCRYVEYEGTYNDDLGKDIAGEFYT